MIIYSTTILSFLKKIHRDAFHILQNEMRINVRKTRVCYDSCTYPLEFVVFEKPGVLGYFDSNYYQIGLHKNLIHDVCPQTLANILRHELAHYICFLKYKNSVDDHGAEYREICRQFHWDADIYGAKLNLNLAQKKIDHLAHDHVISKVKKLMALTSSDNPHEAELATIKANQLLLQHNLKGLTDLPENEDLTYLKRVLNGVRASSKHQAICQILRLFFVKPVFNYGGGTYYIEVVGTKVNVAMADYIANFLDSELERLFKQAKKKNPTMKGAGQKASFMFGLSHGFTEKIKSTQSNIAQAHELVVLKDNLQERVDMAYKRLVGRASSQSTFNPTAQSVGKEAGRNLSIRPGLKNSTADTLQLT